VLFTGIFAYSLAQKKLFFKKTYTMILLISMLFTGGLIPYFILLKNLHLFNTFWVYIIPSMLDGFNTILMISFFRELPESLQESAKIDGANDLVIFFRIIIPVSTPIFATIALFNGVYHWNDWFTTAYFAPDQKLKTVAYMLYELIEKSDIAAIMRTSGAVAASKAVEAHTYTAETIRMSTTFVVVIPIMCIYPFLQKYFVKGIMLGSIKA
jgi:putative aldouronate transport system permease protein